MELILSLASELLVAGHCVLSPTRLLRKLVWGIPLRTSVPTMSGRILLGLLDVALWLAVLLAFAYLVG